MILVGEPHPEFPIHDLIRSLDLEDLRSCARLHAYRAFHRLHVGLRHHPESALSDRGRKLRQHVARAWDSAKRCWSPTSAPSASFPIRVPESARWRGRRRSHLRIPEPAGLAVRPGTHVRRERQGLRQRANAIGLASPVATRNSLPRFSAGRRSGNIPPRPRRQSHCRVSHDAAAAAAAEARPIHNIPFKLRDIENWAEDDNARSYIEDA